MIIYLKRLKSSKFVRVKAFPMYGGIGVSAPSLHRESTDSLIRAFSGLAVNREQTIRKWGSENYVREIANPRKINFALRFV